MVFMGMFLIQLVGKNECSYPYTSGAGETATLGHALPYVAAIDAPEKRVADMHEHDALQLPWLSTDRPCYLGFGDRRAAASSASVHCFAVLPPFPASALPSVAE
jgi:hypothetical protein